MPNIADYIGHIFALLTALVSSYELIMELNAQTRRRRRIVKWSFALIAGVAYLLSLRYSLLLVVVQPALIGFGILFTLDAFEDVQTRKDRPS